MKILFVLWAFILLLLHQSAFSQCPAPGLKIQSASCDSPRNLSVAAITCPSLKVKWQGSSNQTYSVQATGADPLTGQVYYATASQYSCDGNGNCLATIPVREATNVTWSVQGTCSEGTNALSGYQSEYGTTSIPLCQTASNTSTSRFLVYPNPNTGELNIEYSGEVSPNTKFTVFDIAGKKIFTISGNAVTRVGKDYQLNLHSLFAGTYLLKLSNGKEEKNAKFVLIRD